MVQGRPAHEGGSLGPEGCALGTWPRRKQDVTQQLVNPRVSVPPLNSQEQKVVISQLPHLF